MNPAKIRSAAVPIRITPKTSGETTVRGVRQDQLTDGDTVTPRVAAITSVPRLGWNDHWGCATRALGVLGIPITRYTGAFWDHCLERCLEACVASGVDWVLTLDYDSIFTASDVRMLLSLAAAYPEAHAIAPVQSRRAKNQVLFMLKGEDGKPLSEAPAERFAGPLTKVDAAHFGLTLIRVEKLASVPKPWFEHVPDPQGGWGDGRTDSDVRFWQKWNEVGNGLYIANRVKIGHLQLMCSIPGDDLTPEHHYVDDVLNPEG